MYSTCLFCHSHLGRNERLPRFPVGRRLAFDSAKGRLWVVCRTCARWNLTPLEERWEAFDECERLFRSTHVRVSTDNIGLVELPDGVSLIRIGKPLRPEFAAWRYSRHFSRRRVRTGLALAGLATGAAGLALGSIVLGFGALTYAAAYATGLWVADEGPKRRPALRMRFGGRLLHLRQEDAEAARVFADGGDGFGVALHHDAGVVLVRGDAARHVLGRVIPAINTFGGSAREVRGAVELIDRSGSAEVHVAGALRWAKRTAGFLRDFPVETRLALEMSLQEESERRALEGELAALERAWREAEELAEIADTLLMPGEVVERMTGLTSIRSARRPCFAIG